MVPRLTLRARVALTVALACAVAVLLVAGGLFVAVERFLRAAQFERLASVQTLVRDRVERSVRVGYLDLEALRSEDLPLDVSLRVTSGARLVARTQEFPAGVPAALPNGNYLLGERFVLVRPLRVGGQLTLVSGSRSLDEARAAYTRALTVLLPLALVLVAVAGWFTAGRLLRPVRTLERAAREIGESGDLTRRVPGAGERDELQRLALTLQRTFAQLAVTRAREQEFLRAAAHDLRGPLTALRARVSLSLSRDRDAARYRADLVEVDTDLARLSRLATHLLLLARHPDSLAVADVDLREVAARAVDRAREDAPDTPVDLHASGAAWVRGDEVLLGQAVLNLLSNAARHAGGARVDVRVTRGGGAVRLAVHDDGPGVPADVLARLGEAFYRPDAARSGDGHGLGLAIVRHVAFLHGGELELVSSPGAGFTATLVLNVTER